MATSETPADAVNTPEIAKPTLEQVLATIQSTYKGAPLSSLLPLLGLLRLRGKVFTLKDHFMFEPMFRLDRPVRRIFVDARQLGKTTHLCASNLLLSTTQLDYNTLFICPRFEQIKRLSMQVLRPLIMNSPMHEGFQDSLNENSILSREFRSRSHEYFSFAFLDPDRIRGFSGICECIIDEVQDINFEFIPVVGETMSATEYGFFTFTGTPKSLDNTLNTLWKESSMAEWVVKCSHCNYYNIPCTEHDLLRMIGPADGPTCICAHCGQALDCSDQNGNTAGYVHRFPDRRSSFEGYHVPQIIHPYHYKNINKWRELHHKIKSYSKARLFNEVFGESYDSADRMVTLNDLTKASTGGPNTLEHTLQELPRFHPIVIAIDWGGGGVETHSYTAIAIGGCRKGSDVVEALYGLKLPLYTGPRDQVQIVCQLRNKLKSRAGPGVPIIIAHDYTGAGYDKGDMLVGAGIPPESMMPFTYCLSPLREIIHFNPPDNQSGSRRSYSLDKPRSLVVMCAMLKAGKIKLPAYESQRQEIAEGEPISSDFLHLYSETQERPTGGDVFLVKTESNTSDDWAHAVNYLASASWYFHQRYPNLAEALNIRLTAEDVGYLSPQTPDWFDELTQAAQSRIEASATH